MRITRKIINLGNSSVISLPKSWVKYAEAETGQKLKTVSLEVNGVIKLSPYFDKIASKETPK